MSKELDRSAEGQTVAKDMGSLNIEYVRIMIIRTRKYCLLLVKRNCSDTGWLFCRICQTFSFFPRKVIYVPHSAQRLFSFLFLSSPL